jgi:hypothetical protein
LTLPPNDYHDLSEEIQVFRSVGSARKKAQ